MSQKVKGFAAGIIAAVFYGTNPLGTLPLYADGINSSSVLFYRYALATVMFAIWMMATGEHFKIRLGHAIRFAVLGAIFAMSSATLYLSFHYMDAGVASTILFCYPIMVAVLMVAFFHEHITWMTATSITLAIGGIGLLYRSGGGASLSTVGVTLVMLSSLLYAFYIIAISQWKTDMSALKFTFWVVFFGLVSILVFSLLAGERIQLLHGWQQWTFATQLALLPTVLSLFFMTISIKNIGSTPASIMGALEPVTAVFIGVLIFGESFTLRLLIGIILILSGVILIILSRSNKFHHVVSAHAFRHRKGQVCNS